MLFVQRFWTGKGSLPVVSDRAIGLSPLASSSRFSDSWVRHPSDWNEFREAILLGGLREGGGLPLSLAPGFGKVARAWRLYQAHANAILALESFLALALAAMEEDGRAAVRRVAVVERVLEWFRLGLESPCLQNCPGRLPLAPLQNVEAAIRTSVTQEWRTQFAEPELAAAISAQWAGTQGPVNPEVAAGSAAMLFVFTQVRLSLLRNEFKEAWLSPAADWRLPPPVLVRRFDEAIARGETLESHVRKIIEELVIRQHATNVRRKLFSMPKMLTALFLENGQSLEFVYPHVPGTSSPRFLNAVEYLEELGYLGAPDLAGARSLTGDGEALLSAINAQLGMTS